MEDRKDITVPMPGSVVDAVDSQLEYGDSRAGWIRDAITQRLERENIEIEGDEEGNVTSDALSVG